MAGNKEFNTNIEVKGKINLKDVPNNTPTGFLVWNSGIKDIAQRTPAQIISDLGLITAVNIAAAYYTKTQLQTSGQSSVHWNNISNKPATFPPDVHSHTFASITGKPTTIAGYGITDSYVKTQVDTNIKTAVDDIQIGGRNLLLNSKRTLSGTSYLISYFTSSRGFVVGETLTVTIIGNIPGSKLFGVWFNSGSFSTGEIPKIANNLYSKAITVPLGTNTRTIGIHLVGNMGATDAWSFESIKLEKGNKATDWTPAPEDQVSDWSTTDVDDFSFIKNKPTTFPATAHSHQIVDITGLQNELNGKESAFTKNTAFNKNFGTAAGTVAQGNDSRVNNGQTAFGWGNFRDYGLATPVSMSSGQDLSSLDFTGFAKTITGTDYPGGISGNGFVINNYISDTRGHQIVSSVSSDRVFFRRNFNGFTPWVEFIHTENLDSQATSLGFIKSSALPTVNNGQLTLTTGTGLSGSANFTANQSGGSTFSVAVASTHKLPTTAEWTTALANTITRLRGTTSGTFTSGDLTLLAGTGIGVTQSGANFTITNTAPNVQANNGLLTLATGAGLTGGVTFSADQATAANFTVAIANTHVLPTTAQVATWNAKSNLVLGATSSTAYRGDRGTIAYDHSQASHAPTNAQKNSDITKAEIEAKLTGAITTHTHSHITAPRYDTDDPKPSQLVQGLSFQFSYPDGGWHNAINMKAYSDPNYLSTQIVSSANNPGSDTGYNYSLRYREGRNETWLGWKTIWDSVNLTTLSQLTDNIGVATHIANKANPHAVTKAQVGLGSVDNTADSAKNVLSATKLTTARTINGTSFNGSANITTANWGTARTLTIGNTGKSVNGSANVAWSLSEIGAVSLTGNETISGIKTYSNGYINYSNGAPGLQYLHNIATYIGGSSSDSTTHFLINLGDPMAATMWEAEIDIVRYDSNGAVTTVQGPIITLKITGYNSSAGSAIVNKSVTQLSGDTNAIESVSYYRNASNHLIIGIKQNLTFAYPKIYLKRMVLHHTIGTSGSVLLNNASIIATTSLTGYTLVQTINNSDIAKSWGSWNFDPSSKQNTLTAGSNITISGNTISATNTNTTYTAGTGLSLTGTTFANTAPNATHTGDVTGATALTIAASAVTHAKYQNIATQRILGRGATGTGNVQELTLGSNLTLSTAGVLSATNTNTTYTGSLGITLSGTDFRPTYGTSANTVAQGNDTRINNGQTAFGWGNHATAGYIKSSALSPYAQTSWVNANMVTIATPQTITGTKTFNDVYLYGFVVLSGGIQFQEDNFGGEVGLVDGTNERALIVRSAGFYNVFGVDAGTNSFDGFVRSYLNNNYGLDHQPSATYKLSVGGSILATSFYESSLREYKTNIKPFDKSALDLVDSLSIVTFDRKDETVKDKIGIIADDSPKEFLSEELDAVDLYKTVFIQVKAIQELKSEVDELKEIVKQLLNK